MICHRLALLALMLAAPTLVGCKDSKSLIHGNVTYEGAPINRGQITFSPADGHGTAGSAPIEGGKYSVENVLPGKKIVQIIGVKQIQFAKTSEEASKRRAAPETADEVPPNAVGNNQVIETTTGAQELNFDLKRPAR
jgi:hypothetical protein